MPATPGDKITKADVIAKFKELVRDQLTPGWGQAPWYYGNVPGAPYEIQTHNDLGPQWELDVSDADLALASEKIVPNELFEKLRELARRFTKVRAARWEYYNANQAPYPAPEAVGDNNSARFRDDLSPDLGPQINATTVPNPATAVAGNVIRAQEINDFLINLRTKVNELRTSAAYKHTFQFTQPYVPPPCHSSCHVSCHGSRGRR